MVAIAPFVCRIEFGAHELELGRDEEGPEVLGKVCRAWAGLGGGSEGSDGSLLVLALLMFLMVMCCARPRVPLRVFRAGEHREDEYGCTCL